MTTGQSILPIPAPEQIPASRRAGFSLLEVLVVVLIGITVIAIAIPSFVTIIDNVRLRGNVSTLSGIFQNCRMVAVHNNQVMTTHFNPASFGIMAYVKAATNANGPVTTDPQVELEAPITRSTAPTDAGVTALDPLILGFTPNTGDASFNSRGLPCAYSAGVCSNVGFAYYFKDTTRKTGVGWGAVSISPAGRIKNWFWTGSAWGN